MALTTTVSLKTDSHRSFALILVINDKHVSVMFGLYAATEASNEGDGFTELCAGTDRDLYNELHCSVLFEEAEKPGKSQFVVLSVIPDVCPFTSSWPYLGCDVGVEEGILTELSQCYSIVSHYNVTQF